jgi:hypothetical protein
MLRCAYHHFTLANVTAMAYLPERRIQPLGHLFGRVFIRCQPFEEYPQRYRDIALALTFTSEPRTRFRGPFQLKV